MTARVLAWLNHVDEVTDGVVGGIAAVLAICIGAGLLVLIGAAVIR